MRWPAEKPRSDKPRKSDEQQRPGRGLWDRRQLGREEMFRGEEARWVRSEETVLSAVTGVRPDYLPQVVDAGGGGSKAPWGINRRVGAVAVNEAVLRRNAVRTDFVPADDLPGRIDAVSLCIDGARESENGVGAMTAEKGFLNRIAPAHRLKRPDDLALVVHANDIDADASDIGGWLNCRVGAVVVKEALLGAAGFKVKPDDLSLGVDALGHGVQGPRNVENGVVAVIVKETVADAVTVYVSPYDLSGSVDA